MFFEAKVAVQKRQFAAEPGAILKIEVSLF
jgi:hypothetical protein